MIAVTTFINSCHMWVSLTVQLFDNNIGWSVVTSCRKSAESTLFIIHVSVMSKISWNMCHCREKYFIFSKHCGRCHRAFPPFCINRKQCIKCRLLFGWFNRLPPLCLNFKNYFSTWWLSTSHLIACDFIHDLFTQYTKHFCWT